MKRSKSQTTAIKILLGGLLLLSLPKATSFAPSQQRLRSRTFESLSRDTRRIRSKRQVPLYSSVGDDDDEDDYYDDDDEIEYGKFEKESKMHRQEEDNDKEDGGSLPPLPDFLKDDSAVELTETKSTLSSLDETQRRIEDQQRQIDLLMKLVQQQSAQPQQRPQQQPESSPMQFNELSETPPSTPLQTSSHSSSSPTPLAPLKAMLFIDGTWLYYSIHERSENRCPIVRAYGRGWQRRYQFDWAALVRVISEQLALQHAWNSQNVEITRVSVYTSCKKDTSVYSNRSKMFEEMRNNNYDVFMMETVGPGEKCVDIQLAVEMLHYATVPNAYDVAILLSGDKDFLPALVRTRQKGRKVAIVAMRNGCNRALIETPNVKDYDVVWIDDFLDRLMVPRKDALDGNGISIFTISKVIYDFIDKSGLPQVSSRDVGRYLKGVVIGDTPLLDEMKQSYGGLYQFLAGSACFDVIKQTPRDELLARKMDPMDKTFWATLHEDSDRVLLEEAKRAHFSPTEKEFFDNYSLAELIDDDTAYTNSRQTFVPHNDDDSDVIVPTEIPEELKRDFSELKVAELKKECRDRGLPVSGTKAALLERIQADVERQIAQLKQENDARTQMRRPHMSGRINGEGRGLPSRQVHPIDVPPETEQYLEGLVKEYIKARGGRASSRDIGRYLSVNADSTGQAGNPQEGRRTALSELKSLYGGLNGFILNRPESFEKFDDESFDTTVFEYGVALRE